MRIERDILLGDRPVGRVQVQKQGLYYLFTCRCALSGETVWHLLASCGEKQADLGVLVPMEGGFGLTTHRPVKQLGEGKINFTLKPKHEGSMRFAPIYPEEPFSYIEKLKNAFLQQKSGQLGAAWSEK